MANIIYFIEWKTEIVEWQLCIFVSFQTYEKILSLKILSKLINLKILFQWFIQWILNFPSLVCSMHFHWCIDCCHSKLIFFNYREQSLCIFGGSFSINFLQNIDGQGVLAYSNKYDMLINRFLNFTAFILNLTLCVWVYLYNSNKIIIYRQSNNWNSFIFLQITNQTIKSQTKSLQMPFYNLINDKPPTTKWHRLQNPKVNNSTNWSTCIINNLHFCQFAQLF